MQTLRPGYNRTGVDLLVTALAAAGFAGAVAIGVTVAIERWGGVRGGLLGTVPTTIVPFSLGLQAAEPAALREALWAVPVGMLVNALFLLVWRELPPRLAARSLGARLAIVLGASLAVWAAAAGGAVLGMRALRAGGASLFLPGFAAFLALLLGGAIRVAAPPVRGAALPWRPWRPWRSSLPCVQSPSLGGLQARPRARGPAPPPPR